VTETQAPVLIIDDDADVRWALRTILQDVGLATTEACAGDAGLEIAAHAKPSAVLLDLRMSGLSGEEVLGHLKRQYQALPVIVITGYGSISGAVGAMRAGFSAHESGSAFVSAEGPGHRDSDHRQAPYVGRRPPLRHPSRKECLRSR